jgi:hypothetical protein
MHECMYTPSCRAPTVFQVGGYGVIMGRKASLV